MTTDRPAHPAQPSGPAAPGPAQPPVDDPGANVSAAAKAVAWSTRIRTAHVDLSDAEDAAHAADLGPLDVAYSAMALHHLGDVPRLLRTVAGLLRPGGKLVVADLEPDCSLYHADRPSFDGHDGFSHEQISSWCTSAGCTSTSSSPRTSTPSR